MIRPSSNLPQQPPSGISRPPSSLSRPSSAASHRTASRISHRPVSRISQRPLTRQSTRIAPLCQALVTQLTGLTPDKDDGYDFALDQVIRRVDNVTKQAAAPDMQTVQKQLRSFARKARIQSHNNLAEAFDISAERLRAETKKPSDLDNEIKVSKLPEHLQLLILLSLPPSRSTLDHADNIVERTHNPPPAPSGLTWKDILAEEPFEGQHWQGVYGLAPGSVADQWDHEGSSESSPPLSPISDSDLDDRDEVFSIFDSGESLDLSERAITLPLSRMRTGQFASQEERVVESLKLREELETLQKRQYWRSTWRTDARTDRDFDLGEPSTLAPAFQRTTSAFGGVHLSKPENERYINEHDAVREILMGLQGRRNVIFELESDEISPIVSVSPNAPKLLHLTPSAQQSIISNFAQLASSLARLRRFLKSVISCTSDYNINTQTTPSRTVEAFAEAVELQIIDFETWLAQREEMILRAHLQKGRSTIVSLLGLEKAIRDDFSNTFNALLKILCICLPNSSWLSKEKLLTHIKSSPSSFSSRLLDTLFDAIQSNHSFGDAVTASALLRTFMCTAEPVWRMLGRWLKDGIFMPEGSNTASDRVALPQEFFIESNSLDLQDPDFWTDGYELRSRTLDESTSVRHSGVPVFLRTLAESLLGAGKSIGLLRILGHSGKFDLGNGPLSGATWPSFEEFMLELLNIAAVGRPKDTAEHLDAQESKVSKIVLSTEDLSLLLSDHLLPICMNAGKALQEVLYADCDLLYHFQAIENLFLLRKGDVMSDFSDVLFSAMDAQKVWTDYHFLNTAFRDCADSLRTRWIDSPLVRFSYKHNRRSPSQRSVKSFDGLIIEYAAPFPLNFIFDNRASQVYNAIFVLLLQIRRAKTALDNILVRGSAANSVRSQDEMKVFYATRNKLSWFVNTYLNFICSHILHVEIERFHKSLHSASSLDDILRLHQNYLTSLERLCLLHEKTTALHRAVLSILDMSIIFSDCFVTFAGDTTLNISRTSASRSRRHRSRRLRRESRNVVSFEHVSSFRDEESASSSDSDVDESLITQDLSQDADLSSMNTFALELFGEEDFFSQNEKMTKDLGTLVRYIRREVERLTLTTEGSQSFGVLAFSLQDWDL